MVCLSVGRSVGLSLSEPCKKTVEPIEMPFGLWGRVGQRNHVLDGVEIAHEKGQFRAEGGRGSPLSSVGAVCGELCKNS